MAVKIVSVGEGGSMRKALLITAIASIIGSSALQAQTGAGASPAAAPKIDKASAYYHYTLAHMYAEQASMFGNRGDYVNKAIENYKEAIKADPTAAMLSEELSDLYVQSGRLREAQADAEDVLKQNPNDSNAHRLLARIFTRLVGDGRSGKVDEAMLRRATDEYQKITVLAPADIPAWLMLARLQKAAELLKQLAAKNPSARSLTALAAAYEQMRDFKAAAAALRQLLETNPANDREVKRNLAQDLMLSQDYAAALEIYNGLVAD